MRRNRGFRLSPATWRTRRRRATSGSRCRRKPPSPAVSAAASGLPRSIACSTSSCSRPRSRRRTGRRRMLVNICWNIELRNTASKSCASSLRLVGAGAAGLGCLGARSVEAASSAGCRGTPSQCHRHHITSMSAWIAPAALIACRIEIMSRGPMPSALRPSTTCCSDTPSLHQGELLAVLLSRRSACAARPRSAAREGLPAG